LFLTHKQKITADQIEQVYLTENSTEFVIHTCDEYDYQLQSKKRDEIAQILIAEVKNFIGKDLLCLTLAKGHIQSLIKTNKRDAEDEGPISPWENNKLSAFFSEPSSPMANVASSTTKKISNPVLVKVGGTDDSVVPPPLPPTDATEENPAEVNLKATLYYDLIDLVDSIKEVTDMKTTRDIISNMPKDDPYDLVRMLCELFLNFKSAPEFIYLVSSNKKWSKLLIKATLSFLSDKSVRLRYWCLKVIHDFIL
jgi:hypothetical protein